MSDRFLYYLTRFDPNTHPSKSIGRGVFATMNPKCVAGRLRLPRSLANLFLTVTLNDYSVVELRSIAAHIFSPKNERTLVSRDRLMCIFNFHLEIQDAKKRFRQLGTSCDFNLRDLVKVRDAILENCPSYRNFLRFPLVKLILTN